MGTPLSDHVTTGPIEGSTKRYIDVDGDSTANTTGGLRVPVRRINLTNGEHCDVYDTSGIYTETQYAPTEDGSYPTQPDLEAGLERLHESWPQFAAVPADPTSNTPEGQKLSLIHI